MSISTSMRFATEAEILPPKGGWKENTWYLAEVAMNANNPVHKNLFFSGNLNGGDTIRSTEKTPGGYSGGFSTSYVPTDRATNLHEYHYFKVIKVVLSSEETL